MSGPLRRHGRSKTKRAGSIVLQWKTPKNAGKVLVLVEGWEDTLVYDKFFVSSRVRLMDCGGCNDALGIYTSIRKIAPKLERVLILDSDFKYFYGRNIKHANVFYTDTHDMETMVMFDGRCFLNLVKYLKCPNVTHRDIVKDLRLLSYVRWYNMDAKMKYKEKELDIVNMSSAKISDYNHLMTCFEPSEGTTKQWLKRCFDHFRLKYPRARAEHLINGHDYVDRFCHYAKIRNKIQLSSEDVLLGIAMLCDHPWFNSSRIGQQLREWQISEGESILT